MASITPTSSVRATGDSDAGMIGDSARIAVAAALSRATGLLRIVIAASVLGSTVLGDLFVAINVLPLTLYDVFAGSAISSVLVPPLVRLLDRSRVFEAQQFVSNVLGLFGIGLAAIAALAVLGRGWIASLLTAGVDGALRDDATATAGLLLLIILPQLVLYGVIGVLVAVQHAERSFLLPSAAPIVENVGLLITIGVVWMRFGGGFEVADAPQQMILTLAIGSGLSVSAHTVVQFIGARRAIGTFGLSADWRDPDLTELVRPVRDSLGWSGVIASRQFALVVAAGFAGAGGVQAFEIAMLAYFIPLSLIGRPIASAALPRLARARGTSSDSTGLLAGYLNTVRLAGWLAVPAGLGLIFIAEPLARLVAQGEFADERAVTMISYGLMGLGLGSITDALFEIARQATMANGGGKSLRHSTWARAAVAVVGIPLAVLLLDGPAVLLGLGLAVSIGDLVAFAIAHYGLRSLANWPETDAIHSVRILIASLLAVLPLAMATLLSGSAASPMWLPGAVMVLLGVYLLAAWMVTDRGQVLRELYDNTRGEGLA